MVQIMTSHHGPWGSPLWKHLELIQKLRGQRLTWKDIAACLEKEAGLVIKPRTIADFFVRSRNPDLKIPAGLEGLLPSPKPLQFSPDEPERTQKKLTDQYKQNLKNPGPRPEKLFDEKHIN